ncbi:MAG TPA: hypothetical protein VJT31_28605 [Rugosimonospora sp.]|nr:hypothetical protein [Rugosimonospora sp.]
MSEATYTNGPGPESSQTESFWIEWRRPGEPRWRRNVDEYPTAQKAKEAAEAGPMTRVPPDFRWRIVREVRTAVRTVVMV